MIKVEIVNGTILQTNNYIISQQNEVILIETSANIDKIKEIINGKTVKAILLTHGHWDHFLNIEKYIQEFKCKVYMTKSAFHKINKKEKTFYVDKVIDADIDIKDISFIKDNEILSFGKNFNFKVIETKGHTDCSVSYLLNDNLLFTGDTLFKGDFGRYDLPTGNFLELKKSLRKILSLNPNIKVYPGHGEATFIGEEIKTLYFINN